MIFFDKFMSNVIMRYYFCALIVAKYEDKAEFLLING